MLNLVYTLSPELKELLMEIDVLRVKILTSKLSPKAEQRKQWEAQAHRIYYSFLLSGQEITKHEIVRILTGPIKKEMDDRQKAVFNHKRTMDVLVYEWLANPKIVKSTSIIELTELLFDGFRVSHALTQYRLTDGPIKQLLDYLQGQNDHPMIQAGIVYSEFILLAPFGDRSEWIARILAYLFLYKNGFDLRRLLVLEHYWYTTAPEYREAFSTIRKDNNSSRWLSYFVAGAHSQMEKIFEDMEKQSANIEVASSYFYLNDRQRLILQMLEHPDERVTNKKVQKSCSVSQITASRDLARLVSLSLVFPHGKGRSVYYTKA